MRIPVRHIRQMAVSSAARRSDLFTAGLATQSGITGWWALLANRDARTKINSSEIYTLKMRAQIGPVMPKITGQTV
jgi:hypothetical protein